MAPILLSYKNRDFSTKKYEGTVWRNKTINIKLYFWSLIFILSFNLFSLLFCSETVSFFSKLYQYGLLFIKCYTNMIFFLLQNSPLFSKCYTQVVLIIPQFKWKGLHWYTFAKQRTISEKKKERDQIET